MERREKERERDLNDQLDTVQRDLATTRSEFNTAETKCSQEMAQMQKDWRAAMALTRQALDRAECIWRDLVMEEKDRLVKELQERERERFDVTQRVVGDLAEQVSRLSEIVATKLTDIKQQQQHEQCVEREIEKHRVWLQEHKKKESEFLCFFKETCTQLQNAIHKEEQAREESMRRIEQLLMGTTTNTTSNNNSSNNAIKKVYHF
ncbi:uncharacterized protein TM35_000121270 [Trypanosoma theileri]|uniref:Uncharacterized protein n=1 Tax=Trypanosoma theileri TaxID=67003 RepID=A0A1X0NXD2_9TRYP|nr:uncharacterized protein TM35_000121270 [Trypanosoma theileri]ORC89352.1 hypothetical protein TM35_000121270 [Trypanosoma theileri]